MWFGEKADRYIFDPSATKEASIACETNASLVETQLCMRIILNGHACPFGILGCKFIPNTGGTTSICVSIFEPNHEQSLKTGLTHEFAEIVLSCAAINLKQRNFLGSGILHFDRGQYHEADSSRSIFKLLTAALLSFLDFQNQPKTALEIETLVSNLLHQKT
jgi:hypothetical protein